MIKDTYRLWQFFLFIISFSVFYASLYFQFVQDLQPCPLCLMQRGCVFVAVITSLIGVFMGRRRGGNVLLIMQMIIAVAGLYFATRQIWLQSLPADQMPACLPGFEVLIRYFPWRDILYALVWGAADCGEVTWQWLGLSMPAWAALYFAGLFIGAFITRYFLRQTRTL
ncbi:MAG: disulfide bond formation protein B [Legionella sp.]|nr:disulfide bond formation protein B [Legionella sp.]